MTDIHRLLQEVVSRLVLAGRTQDAKIALDLLHRIRVFANPRSPERRGRKGWWAGREDEARHDLQVLSIAEVVEKYGASRASVMAQKQRWGLTKVYAQEPLSETV